MRDFGLLMCAFAMHVGRDKSIIQHGDRELDRHTDKQILRMDHLDPFVTSRAIQSCLPPSKGVSISTQTISNRLIEKQLRAQQTASGVLLSTRNRGARLFGVVVFLTGPTNGIWHCSKKNLAFVYEGTITVDWWTASTATLFVSLYHPASYRSVQNRFGEA